MPNDLRQTGFPTLFPFFERTPSKEKLWKLAECQRESPEGEIGGQDQKHEHSRGYGLWSSAAAHLAQDLARFSAV